MAVLAKTLTKQQFAEDNTGQNNPLFKVSKKPHNLALSCLKACRKPFWIFVILVALASTFIKIWLSALNDFGGTVSYTLATLFCMICLFLLEGMVTVMQQLRDADNEGARKYITENIQSKHGHTGAVRAQRFLRCAQEKTQFDKFIDGREMLVMIVVVTITILVAKFPVPEAPNLSVSVLPEAPANEGRVVKLLLYFKQHDLIWWRWQAGPLKDLNDAWSKTGDALLWLARQSLFDALVAALIPCWIAQLLPQRLALERQFEFGRLPGAYCLKKLCILVADFGAGWPAEVAGQWIKRRLKRFAGTEEFSVGPKKVFENQRSFTNSYIGTRTVDITFSKTQCHVRERLTYVLHQNKTDTLWTSFRFLAEPIGSPDFTITAPDHTVQFKERPDSFHVLVTQTSGSQQIVNDERVDVLRVDLGGEFPREQDGGQAVFEIGIDYNIDPIVSGNAYIDLSGLTERLVIRLKADPGVFLRPPRAELKRTIALLRLARDSQDGPRPIPHKSDGNNGWELEVDYPPLGWQANMELIVLDSHPTGS